MIVGYEFPGDTNKTLKMVQHDCYWGKGWELFNAARNRYVAACRFVGVETEVFERILTLDRLDHRVLQGAHDKIAAYYRFAHDDGGQMTLFPLEKPIQSPYFDWENASYERKLLWRWVQFYDEEVKKLVEDDSIARAIVTAVAYENSPKGYDAEKILAELLEQWYGELKIEGSENDMWRSASKLEDND